MHCSGSHSATMSEMLRFSYWVVPDGYVPSTGSADTGRSSPRPISILAVTSRTNCGAEAGTASSRPWVLVTAAGTSTCLLYTSDAADDLTRVDLGRRRNFKNKTNTRAGAG